MGNCVTNGALTTAILYCSLVVLLRQSTIIGTDLLDEVVHLQSRLLRIAGNADSGAETEFDALLENIVEPSARKVKHLNSVLLYYI